MYGSDSWSCDVFIIIRLIIRIKGRLVNGERFIDFCVK